MPLLNLSELNIVLTVGGVFLSVFGYFSHALKEKWFVGEACEWGFVGCHVSGALMDVQCRR